MDRIPLPKPIDGDDASYCLEQLADADNAAWNTYTDAIKAAQNDTDVAIATLAYIAAYAAAVSAYYACMNVIPPSP